MKEYIKTLKNLMQEYGTTAFLQTADGWRSCAYPCFLQPLRYKNKMYLEGVQTPLGLAASGYYLYIGPPEHDLSKLGDDAAVNIDGKKYQVSRSEKIYLGESAWYVWAVLISCSEDVRDEQP